MDLRSVAFCGMIFWFVNGFIDDEADLLSNLGPITSDFPTFLVCNLKGERGLWLKRGSSELGFPIDRTADKDDKDDKDDKLKSRMGSAEPSIPSCRVVRGRRHLPRDSIGHRSANPVQSILTSQTFTTLRT